MQPPKASPSFWGSENDLYPNVPADEKCSSWRDESQTHQNEFNALPEWAKFFAATSQLQGIITCYNPLKHQPLS